MSQSTSPAPIKLPEGGESTRSIGWVPLDLSVSTELKESLDELAEQSNHSVEDVLVRAVALYRFLSERARAGKHVGVAREGQELEFEIEGF